MEYRAGKCSQCGAEYQIPASFAHNVARCKKCKSGVVHLSAPARGPATPAAPAAEPARAVGAPGRDPSPPAEPRTTSASRAAEASPERPVPAPRLPVATTAAADAGAPPVRAPVEQSRRSRTPLLLGLALLALAAVLFLLRAQIFGSEPAGEVSPPPAPGAAGDAAHESAPTDDG